MLKKIHHFFINSFHPPQSILDHVCQFQGKQVIPNWYKALILGFKMGAAKLFLFC